MHAAGSSHYLFYLPFLHHRLHCLLVFFLASDKHLHKHKLNIQYIARKCTLLLFTLPPHPLFPHPSKCLFPSLVKLLFSRPATNVQMIGFVSKEKRESCFTRRSTAKHLTPAKERKQSRLAFAKSILLSSQACFLCVPFTLPPAAVLPSQLFPRNNVLVNLFPFNS